ncbi:hypothetical protein HP062_24270 [Pseudomonas sp. B14-6]|uniref:hypothetical protein n=1 Tax=Pseudomonas sp. B14-6 TaxID=2738843 RepID=UPI00155EAAEA|nr:hypothetical protein [Pseudomonas sp. B14-6]QKG68478.1 hypothetical protein HP062_24270 [Pseudomonas sp. B14-6]
MSNSKWMLHHFHNLDVSTDCRSAPAWYYDAAEILLLDFEGEAFLALYSVMKFGGLSPLYPLIHGDCCGHGYSAALLFEAEGIYPTGEYILRKRLPYKPIAIALLKSELISAGALESPLPVIRNYDTELLPDDLHNHDISQDIAIEFIQSEINAIAGIQIRPSPSEVTFQSKKLYWQPTSIEIHSPIELYNALSPSFHKVRLPAIRLFGSDEDNCHISKVYLIVDERKYAESIQNLATGLYHAQFNCSGIAFSEQRLLDTKIIITDELLFPADQSLTIEDIELYHPNAIVQAVDNLTVFDSKIDARISEAIEEAIKHGKNAASDFLTAFGEPSWPCGGAHVETFEITHPIVQHMIRSGLVETFDDYAILHLAGIHNSMSRYVNEAACKAACETLERLLGVSFYMSGYDD